MDDPAADSSQTVVGSSGDSFDCHAGVGAHGGGKSSGSTGALAHALPAKVVPQPALGSQEAQAPHGERSPISAGGLALLGVPTASVDGDTTGLSDLLHSGVHVCIPDGLGRGTCLGRAKVVCGLQGKTNTSTSLNFR